MLKWFRKEAQKLFFHRYCVANEKSIRVHNFLTLSSADMNLISHENVN